MTDTTPQRRPREIESSERMSEHEALMWNVEKDPWMNPSGAALVLLDQPVDQERFERTMRYAISQIPKFRERVVPGFGRLSTPAWAPDAEFEFEHHVRHMTLPAPGTHEQLLELATQLYQEPLDRTRPLWRFVSIDGLADGSGALWMLTHHAISDGIGQLRMAELYQDLTADAPMAPEVDLDALIAEEVAAHREKERGGDLATDLRTTLTRTTSHLVRRQLGLSRRLAGELALWPADPARVGDRVEDVAAMAKGTLGQLSGPSEGEGSSSGSPLWAERSRHRHLEHVRVPLDRLKRSAKHHGATINDAYLAVMVDAVIRYHVRRDVALEGVNTSFVLSTRKNTKAGGNAFTPVALSVSGAEMSMPDRIADIHDAVAEAREDAAKSGGMTALSGVANLLPTSVVTRVARSRSASIDIATSNLRSAPFPVYVSGARVMATIPMGPLAGTPCNATAMSAENNFDVGLFMDPTAIGDPADFRTCVEEAFDDLLALDPGAD